jgi:hypothetical protein
MKIIGQKIITDQSSTALAQGLFNGGEHTFLELEHGKHQTVSVKLPNGKFITLAFVPSNDPNEVECADIHTTCGAVYKNSNGEISYQQSLIGFGDHGCDTFATRVLKVPTGLATILLHSNHNQKVPKK